MSEDRPKSVYLYKPEPETPKLSTDNHFLRDGAQKNKFGQIITGFDNVSEQYLEDANNHLSELTIAAIKLNTANQLIMDVGKNTMDLVQWGSTRIRESAHRSDGTELAEPMDAFSTHLLNFQFEAIGEFSTATRENMLRVLERTVTPKHKSWLEKVFSKK